VIPASGGGSLSSKLKVNSVASVSINVSGVAVKLIVGMFGGIFGGSSTVKLTVAILEFSLPSLA
jgi:hypothetical protein